MTDYVVYYRVSTQKQGRSGLGLEGQRTMVNSFLKEEDEVIAEFTEIQSGSKDSREELQKCLSIVKKTKSKLLIPKLDRFSRKVSFISRIIDEGVDIVVCEHPNVTTFFLHLLACFAEEERRQISERTRVALREAKKRGTQLGKNGKVLAEKRIKDKLVFFETIRSHFEEVSDSSSSISEIAVTLNERGIKTSKGGKWYPQTVKNYLPLLQG